jgi:transporter family-2 protein
MSILMMILAIVAGALLPLQASINAKLSQYTPSMMHAALINFAVGLVLLLGVLGVMRAGVPTASSLAQAPWWAWVGGLIGAAYVALAIYLAPKLGVVLLLAATLVGQTAGSMAIDHFGIAGMPVKPIGLGRLAGIALLIAGVVLIRRS